jgi:phage gpG-like protein
MPGGIGYTLAYDDLPVRQAAEAMIRFPGDRSRRMYGAIGGAMVSSSKLRFRRGAGPDNTRWPLSQRVKKRGGQTLVLTARLRDSNTYNVLGDSGVEWGSNVRYAHAQNDGAVITSYPRSQQANFHVNRDGSLGKFAKRRKSNFAMWVTLPQYQIHIPARPWLGIDADDRQEIADIQLRHVDAAMKGKPSPGGAA